jgi:hypothetical protein
MQSPKIGIGKRPHKASGGQVKPFQSILLHASPDHKITAPERSHLNALAPANSFAENGCYANRPAAVTLVLTT